MVADQPDELKEPLRSPEPAPPPNMVPAAAAAPAPQPYTPPPQYMMGPGGYPGLPMYANAFQSSRPSASMYMGQPYNMGQANGEGVEMEEPPQRQFIDGEENKMGEMPKMDPAAAMYNYPGYMFQGQFPEDYYKYYSPYGQYAPQAYCLPGSDYIQVVRPNFININNVNAMGNALIISGNQNAQVNMAQPAPAMKPAAEEPEAPPQPVNLPEKLPSESEHRESADGAEEGEKSKDEAVELFRIEVNLDYYRRLYSGGV